MPQHATKNRRCVISPYISRCARVIYALLVLQLLRQENGDHGLALARAAANPQRSETSFAPCTEALIAQNPFARVLSSVFFSLNKLVTIHLRVCEKQCFEPFLVLPVGDR